MLEEKGYPSLFFDFFTYVRSLVYKRHFTEKIGSIRQNAMLQGVVIVDSCSTNEHPGLESVRAGIGYPRGSHYGYIRFQLVP